MKWSRSELLNLKDKNFSFTENLSFNKAEFKNFSRLNGLKNVVVDGKAYFDDETQLLTTDLVIQGIMLVPCAITLEEVEYPFEIESSETFSFEEDLSEHAHIAKGEFIELLPVILQIILSEVPLKVVKPGLKDYPKGDGWEVVTEEKLIEVQKNQIDPRLAKLLEYQHKDD